MMLFALLAILTIQSYSYHGIRAAIPYLIVAAGLAKNWWDEQDLVREREKERAEKRGIVEPIITPRGPTLDLATRLTHVRDFIRRNPGTGTQDEIVIQAECDSDLLEAMQLLLDDRGFECDESQSDDRWKFCGDHSELVNMVAERWKMPSAEIIEERKWASKFEFHFRPWFHALLRNCEAHADNDSEYQLISEHEMSIYAREFADIYQKNSTACEVYIARQREFISKHYGKGELSGEPWETRLRKAMAVICAK
jgi:hypothetical protein